MNKPGSPTPAPSRTRQHNANPLISQPDREWLETGARSAVQKTFFQRHPQRVNIGTGICYMSESTLLRQLKRLTGLSRHSVHSGGSTQRSLRLLLENRSYSSIAQVASKAGAMSMRALTKSFKQRFRKSTNGVDMVSLWFCFCFTLILMTENATRLTDFAHWGDTNFVPSFSLRSRLLPTPSILILFTFLVGWEFRRISNEYYRCTA